MDPEEEAFSLKIVSVQIRISASGHLGITYIDMYGYEFMSQLLLVEHTLESARCAYLQGDLT